MNYGQLLKQNHILQLDTLLSFLLLSNWLVWFNLYSSNPIDDSLRCLCCIFLNFYLPPLLIPVSVSNLRAITYFNISKGLLAMLLIGLTITGTNFWWLIILGGLQLGESYVDTRFFATTSF